MEAFSLHLEPENFVFAFRITDPLLLFIKTDQQKLSLTMLPWDFRLLLIRDSKELEDELNTQGETIFGKNLKILVNLEFLEKMLTSLKLKMKILKCKENPQKSNRRISSSIYSFNIRSLRHFQNCCLTLIRRTILINVNNN